MDSCHCVSCIRMMSTRERINYRHTLEWKACKYQPLQHCTLIESLMRRGIQRCCSRGDRAKIKGFMKSLLSKLATKNKWLSNMVFCKRYMVLFCHMHKAKIYRGSETGNERCDAYSTAHLSQPFLAWLDFCLFTTFNSSSLIVWLRRCVFLSVFSCRCQPLVLFNCVFMDISARRDEPC